MAQTQETKIMNPLLVIQGVTALASLFSSLSPTLAARLPAVASAASSTTAAGSPAGGSTNPILFIQELLAGAGHPVTADGELGPETLSAVDAWAEQELGVVPGGLLSVALREALSRLDPALSK